jgi:hypothetical protein
VLNRRNVGISSKYDSQRIAVADYAASNYDSGPDWRLMARELQKKRDEAKQAWKNATVAMKAKRADDFTGSKKAHDEAEKLRVEYLMAEKASETDSDDSEDTLAMSAHA